ncbi:MAG: hypothetical protein Q4F83_14280 [Eubacteriales bacterium]|nr:hypothetical protein [Eubacteriales bacterium]
MLRLEKITRESKDTRKIERLYLSAFPQNERTSLEQFWKEKPGKEVYGIYREDCFCGFVQMLSYGDITHILYFAVEEEQRENGSGSETLMLIGRLKPGRRIIADIEAPGKTARNYRQRCRRKNFYLRNGYKQTPVKYSWQGEYYEILSWGGWVNEKEFKEFQEYCHTLEEG